jgi:hypothetical protein
MSYGPELQIVPAVKSKPEDKLPLPYYERPDWFDTKNAQIKIICAKFGAKPQVASPLIHKNLEHLTVLPPGITFESHEVFMTLTYKKKLN